MEKKKSSQPEIKIKYYHKRLRAKDTKSSIIKTLRILKDYKLSIVFAFLFATVGQVMSLLVPFVLVKMIEDVNALDGHAVTTKGLLIVFLIVFGTILRYCEGWISATISTKLTKSLRTRIIQKINRMPLSYFDRASYGDIMSRLTNDVDIVGSTFEDTLSTLIYDATMLIGIPIVMFIISWKLTLIALCEIPLSLLIVFIIVKNNQKYFVRQQRYFGEMNGYIEENFSAHNIVKAFNGEEKAYKEFSVINNALRVAGQKARFLSSLIHPIINFVGNLTYITICLVGAYIALQSNNYLFAASIAGFMTYIKMFNDPISSLGSISSTLQQTAAAAERVFEFLEEKEQDTENDKNKTLKKVKGKVEFCHVNFGYTKDREIIHDFNFTALPGQKIAIVGPTGAGKTTIVNLLMRFYEVSSGQIKIDGVPIQDMKRSYVRSLFGMVLQDTWLFEGTIKDNITFGKPEATLKEIQKACKLAGVDHFIKTQPNGYENVINEDSSISAGQKQLLTIARAMVQNAPILIFDEATSSVDTRTEILIQNAMDKLTRGRTSFVIAHRLSTIKNADQIIVMKDGAIVEIGKHKNLLDKKGVYAELYYSQFEKGEEI